MSTKALQLYWLQFKAFIKSNWKYALAFSIGSLISTIFSVASIKSLTGYSTFELILKILILKKQKQYRQVINYNGFSKTPSPTRPSTESIAWDAFMRDKTFVGKIKNYKKPIAEIRKSYLKQRQRLHFIRHKRYGLKSFVQTPKEIIIATHSANNNGPLKAYLLQYPGTQNENGVILYIHGGAFYLGFPEFGYGMLQIMEQYLGMTALCIDYHLCPEISVPQQVDECIEAYKYILNTMKIDSQKIFIMGASAGGSLTLLTLQKLKTLKLPQPCGAVPISATVDATYQTALKTVHEGGINDAALPICINYFYMWDLRIDEEERKQWDSICGLPDDFTDEKEKREQLYKIVGLSKYSPLNGNWEGLCPLYISATYQEALINDSRLIIEKCKQFDIEYEYAFDPYLLHAAPVFCDKIVEARDRIIIIIEWMRKQLKVQKINQQ